MIREHDEGQERQQFERPDWWGSKVWHKVRTKKNKRVKKPKRPKVWDKDDL